MHSSNSGATAFFGASGFGGMIALGRPDILSHLCSVMNKLPHRFLSLLTFTRN